MTRTTRGLKNIKVRPLVIILVHGLKVLSNGGGGGGDMKVLLSAAIPFICLKNFRRTLALF
jgi:hypothetical protein